MSAGPELERLFWIVIAGLASVLSAIAVLVRSGRVTAPEIRVSSRIPRAPRARHAPPAALAARSRP